MRELRESERGRKEESCFSDWLWWMNDFCFSFDMEFDYFLFVLFLFSKFLLNDFYFKLN